MLSIKVNYSIYNIQPFLVYSDPKIKNMLEINTIFGLKFIIFIARMDSYIFSKCWTYVFTF